MDVRRRIIIFGLGSLFVFCMMLAKASYGQASNGPMIIAEVTDSPTIVPTPAPFQPTPMPAGNLNLLANGGFETSAREADLWQVANASKDKIVCNSSRGIYAFQGTCAYRFYGVEAEKARLVQKLDVSNYTFAAGDTLSLRGYYRTAKANPQLRIKMKVYYTDATREVVNTLITAPSEYYIAFELPQVVVDSNISRIKIQFLNRARNGKIFIDGAELVFTATDGSIP